MQKFNLAELRSNQGTLNQLLYLVRTDLLITWSLYLLPSIVSVALVPSNPLLGLLLTIVTLAIAVLLMTLKLLSLTYQEEKKQPAVQKAEEKVETKQTTSTPSSSEKVEEPKVPVVRTVYVRSTRPEEYDLSYCNFQLDLAKFNDFDEVVPHVVKTIARQYASIRSFNPEVEELAWTIPNLTSGEVNILELQKLSTAE